MERFVISLSSLENIWHAIELFEQVLHSDKFWIKTDMSSCTKYLRLNLKCITVANSLILQGYFNSSQTTKKDRKQNFSKNFCKK